MNNLKCPECNKPLHMHPLSQRLECIGKYCDYIRPKVKVNPKELTTDGWSEQYPKLLDDIEAHISVYMDNEMDIYDLRRLIFISIRDKLGDKLGDKLDE